MAVTEYKLYFREGIGASAPKYVVDGGQFQDLDNGTMLGWYKPDTETQKFDYDGKDSIVEMTLSQIIQRQIDLHQRYPVEIPDPNNPESAASTVIASEEQLIEMMTAWYDYYVTNNIPSNPTQSDLDVAKKEKLRQAFNYMEKKLDEDTVSVYISSVGANCTFGCDKTTQDNIIGINTAISRGVNIPNPTYWTPKNSADPVVVTHDELADIGGNIFLKKNDLYGIYFTHKSNILNSTDYKYVVKYDYATGY